MHLLQYGWTALMKASEAGHMECVQMLLDKGAEVNIHDKVRCHYTLCTCNAVCTHSPQYWLKTCAQEPYCVHTCTCHVV